MIPARFASGRNSALKSPPETVATFFASSGWHPRTSPDDSRPQLWSTRRRTFLSSAEQ